MVKNAFQTQLIYYCFFFLKKGGKQPGADPLPKF